METKHTPGNWAIGKSDSVVVSDRIPDDYSLNGGHDDTEYYGGFCICESIAKKADAKLIAAAPEMLDVLQKIVKYWGTPQKGSLHSHIMHPINLAEAAIKKATE